MKNSFLKLPHESAIPYITDGGLETTLVFHEGLDLPCFAAFHLLKNPAACEILETYFHGYASLARKFGAGLVLDSPTWRASADWGTKLGYSESGLNRANRDGIGMMHGIRAELESPEMPIVISGATGPRGDGYQASFQMTADEAARYHTAQIRTLRDAGADMITAYTLNYVEEAIGIANAAAALDIPAVISFTVETDGNLPTGQSLKEAIETVDARTGMAPAYYMINCAHPTHFRHTLSNGEPWLDRIGGLRPNASSRSHAELDESTELDTGNPAELARQSRELMDEVLVKVNVLGGCCGTDLRHLEAICESCLPVPSA